ncbi:MAG: hypothetical protein ACKO2H_00330, partial [Bacteroidota bacterium]
GFFVPGEARSMISIPNKERKELMVMVASCKDTIRTFSYTIPSTSTLIQLDDKEVATHAIVQYKSGKKQLIEFFNGFGYYSQQSKFVVMDKDAISVTFYHHSTIVKTVKK